MNYTEQAEKIAYRSAEYIKENLDDYLKTDVEKSKKQGKIVYELPEEKLTFPNTNAEYNTTEQENERETDNEENE